VKTRVKRFLIKGWSEFCHFVRGDGIDSLSAPSAGKNEQGPTATLTFLASMAI
jgi:hypothetical protein